MLEAAGLSPTEIAAWEESRPARDRDFAAAARASSGYLTGGERLLARLPARSGRTDVEAEAATRLKAALDAERIGSCATTPRTSTSR